MVGHFSWTFNGILMSLAGTLVIMHRSWCVIRLLIRGPRVKEIFPEIWPDVPLVIVKCVRPFTLMVLQSHLKTAGSLSVGSIAFVRLKLLPPNMWVIRSPL